MTAIQFENSYLNDYMAMVEDTESPRIFHLWSAIYAISTSLGRRCFVPFGPGEIFANHYILMVGTPASRKSTAMKIAARLVRDSTGVRFAPGDTGGQRQGLVLAMQGVHGESKEFLNGVELGAAQAGILGLEELAAITNVPETEEARFVAEADKHHLAVAAGEFSRFIGQGNHGMLDFLVERWDGDPYEYKTRQSSIYFKDTLMNLIACTTPVSLNASMPPGSGGQGFLSRLILVYGAQKYKEIPWPEPPSVELVCRVKDTLEKVYYGVHGMFGLTPAAKAYSEGLYSYNLEISDPRFTHYADRRFTHLIKLAMCLAATRETTTIEKIDFEEAHRILRATERGMPDALGEFGLNPLALLKQEILEQLRASQGPVTIDEVVQMFHRDAKTREIVEVLNDLVRSKQVKGTQLKNGATVFTATFSRRSAEDDMLKLLMEN